MIKTTGLALGGHGNNKVRIVEEGYNNNDDNNSNNNNNNIIGAVKPLVDLLRFPDRGLFLLLFYYSIIKVIITMTTNIINK